MSMLDEDWTIQEEPSDQEQFLLDQEAWDAGCGASSSTAASTTQVTARAPASALPGGPCTPEPHQHYGSSSGRASSSWLRPEGQFLATAQQRPKSSEPIAENEHKAAASRMSVVGARKRLFQDMATLNTCPTEDSTRDFPSTPLPVKPPIRGRISTNMTVPEVHPPPPVLPVQQDEAQNQAANQNASGPAPASSKAILAEGSPTVDSKHALRGIWTRLCLSCWKGDLPQVDEDALHHTFPRCKKGASRSYVAAKNAWDKLQFGQQQTILDHVLLMNAAVIEDKETAQSLMQELYEKDVLDADNNAGLQRSTMLLTLMGAWGLIKDTTLYNCFENLDVAVQKLKRLPQVESLVSDIVPWVTALVLKRHVPHVGHGALSVAPTPWSSTGSFVSTVAWPCVPSTAACGCRRRTSPSSAAPSSSLRLVGLADGAAPRASSATSTTCRRRA